MIRTKSINFATVAAVPLAALTVAGCGGSSNNNSGGATAATPPAHTSTVSTTKSVSACASTCVQVSGITMSIVAATSSRAHR